MKKISGLIATCLLLLTLDSAGQVSTVEFGKNRLQYQKFHWKYYQTDNFNPYFSLGLQMVISGVFLIAFTGVTGQSIPIAEIPWRSWASIAFLVIFGSIVAFIAYLYALQNLPTEQTSIYAYVNPVVAVLLGSLLFDERITIFIAIGGAITLLGVYLVNRAFKGTPPPEQPEPEGV